eukprot:scaffold10191_cov283-Chaetoceros_neogracile.AAC.7
MSEAVETQMYILNFAATTQTTPSRLTTSAGTIDQATIDGGSYFIHGLWKVMLRLRTDNVIEGVVRGTIAGLDTIIGGGAVTGIVGVLFGGAFIGYVTVKKYSPKKEWSTQSEIVDNNSYAECMSHVCCLLIEIYSSQIFQDPLSNVVARSPPPIMILHLLIRRNHQPLQEGSTGFPMIISTVQLRGVICIYCPSCGSHPVPFRRQMLPSMTPSFAFYFMGAHSASVFALSAGVVTIGQIVKTSEPVFVTVVAQFVCKK